MSNAYFSFKQFTVHQSRSAMKVGTDGVLLGAWCGRERELERQSRSGDCPSERWLDVGTGTGVIALMLAQRFPQAEVDALEPDRAACEDARYNFAESPWGARLHLLPMRLQEYVTRATVRYDHIVSNPPYFVEALPSPDAARTQARHAGTLPYDALLDGAAVLLKETGTFSLILPPEESRRFRLQATARGWWLQRMTEVSSTVRSGVRRVLMQWGRPTQTVPNVLPSLEVDQLLIHGEGGEYTLAYRTLTRDFYLRF